MRACQICGVPMRVLFPVRIGTAVRWACEWCVRDRFQKEHLDACIDPPEMSPGDPDGEDYRGGEAKAATRDAHDALRKWK